MKTSAIDTQPVGEGQAAPPAKKRRSVFAKKKRNDVVFYAVLLVLPLAQFCIFYIGVNINSVLLAFKDIKADPTGAGYIETWVGFDNLRRVWYDLFHEYVLIQSAKNSIIVYLWSLLFGIPLALFFSFYIYKRGVMSGLFKVILFMPSVLSNIAMVVIFRYLVESGIPGIAQSLFGVRIEGLLANSRTTFGTILFYSIWTGFGTGILMYSGAMGSISDSIVEAAKIDGITPLKEFVHITLPMIWPTLVTFLVTGIAGIFTNQMSLFSFYGKDADYRLYTFGYYLYKNTSSGTYAEYPYLAAMGVLITLVLVPVTLIGKWALERFGPRAD